MTDTGQVQLILEKLKRVRAAREMNAELRHSFQTRLAYVDAQLFVLRKEQQAYPYRLFYEQRKIWGISDPEVPKLVQLFWGKNRLESTPDHEGRLARPRSSPLSAVVQRANFMNSRRNARQRSILFNVRPIPRLAVLAKPSLCFMDPRFVIIDAVRYIVMRTVFGESFSLSGTYPCMNIRKIRTLVTKFSNSGSKEKNLSDYGIDLEAIRAEIRAVLDPR